MEKELNARGREGWELVLPFAWGREIGVLIFETPEAVKMSHCCE
jgi:hypothetical protein